jgi:hypothetical protein
MTNTQFEIKTMDDRKQSGSQVYMAVDNLALRNEGEQSGSMVVQSTAVYLCYQTSNAESPLNIDDVTFSSTTKRQAKHFDFGQRERRVRCLHAAKFQALFTEMRESVKYETALSKL